MASATDRRSDREERVLRIIETAREMTGEPAESFVGQAAGDRPVPVGQRDLGDDPHDVGLLLLDEGGQHAADLLDGEH